LLALARLRERFLGFVGNGREGDVLVLVLVLVHSDEDTRTRGGELASFGS
jgi:hypothetical protein